MKLVPFPLLILIALSGCRAKLGECDEANLQIAYTLEGAPMYAGQALMDLYCATQCHGSGLTGSAREGAPFGMNLDTVHLDPTVCTPGTLNTDACLLEQRRLATATQIAFDFRDLSWNEIEQDRMPPRGARNFPETDRTNLFLGPLEAGGTVNPSREIPSIREAETRDLIRNWMACGLPIVGVLQPTRNMAEFNQECPESTIPDDSFFQCRFSVEPRMEVEPNFDDIYLFFTEQGCTSSSCHGGDDPEFPDMRDIDTAFTSLTTENGATPGSCSDRSTPYVDMGSPDDSVLMIKLLAVDSDDVDCGDQMPATRNREFPMGITGGIRDWITMGAPRN
ncbi:MAG: hypothetical protein AAF938_25580 [Myxococcota bacterium]